MCLRVLFSPTATADCLQTVFAFLVAAFRARLRTLGCGHKQTSTNFGEEAAHCRVRGGDDGKIGFDKEDGHHVKVVPRVVGLQSVAWSIDKTDDCHRGHA